eukprot:2224793-Pyramimonas_sp.AAC.1
MPLGRSFGDLWGLVGRLGPSEGRKEAIGVLARDCLGRSMAFDLSQVHERGWAMAPGGAATLA